MIRALLFDLGNVLVHFDHDRMCRQIGVLVGRPGLDVRRQLMDSGLFYRFESNCVTREQMHIEVEKLFGQELDRAALRQAAADIFWRNESIEPVVERLAKSGWPLILVSNTSDAHIGWVAERFHILRWFDRRILSFEVGACKPGRAIFDAAAQAAGVAPQECFFTDDTPGHVEAAQQLGFDAVVYEGTPQLVHHLTTRGILS